MTNETTTEATVGKDNGVRRVYIVEVEDKYDKTSRRFLIEVHANTPDVAHRLAMRAGYAMPRVKSLKKAGPTLERTLYNPDGSIEKVESYDRLYRADAEKYADEIRKMELWQNRQPLSTFRISGKDYKPGTLAD